LAALFLNICNNLKLNDNFLDPRQGTPYIFPVRPGLKHENLTPEHFFGEARQEGTSHKVYKTPWEGDPRVNIQEKNGKGKGYQVKQVLAAIKKLQGGAK